MKESFWTVPEDEWSRLWVRVRWSDFSPRDREVEADAGCVNVAALVNQPVVASFGFRSLALHGGVGCTGVSAVSPLLLDLDLDGDTQDALNDLLRTVRAELVHRRWSFRVYDSGVGYHVEIDPTTVEPHAWCLDARYARELRDDISTSVDGRGSLTGGKACIDRTHGMMRMVGSAHRAGRYKALANDE